ncbi:SIMPL domain-containing protein [Brucepastera parasyntrophica]|uniref:SIMPL domain-containing protein n=1 Tax=Brucepastera parasyntrophica TaxID=2880008 RepID=UPI00210A164D|nr:SIMPL domain-containing protein [Brucepastera parasyntrophica]ULQ58553.1 SIMPL domain-containing protein [Brucepastera parasyntrophica]
MKNNCKIFAAGILFFSLLLAGCDKAASNVSTVSVSGTGTVFAQPDMVQMLVTFSYVAPTTREAKQVVDGKVKQVLDILKESNIDDTNIKTVSLNYDTETEYQNGRSVWVGQRASQSISVTVNDINADTDRLPALLDRISAVDTVRISNVSFDVKEKTELFEKARELAYQKAYEKAVQFARLSGLGIVKVLTINEDANTNIFYGTQSNIQYERLVAQDAVPSSHVPTGEQEITTKVAVQFLLK